MLILTSVGSASWSTIIGETAGWSLPAAEAMATQPKAEHMVQLRMPRPMEMGPTLRMLRLRSA